MTPTLGVGEVHHLIVVLEDVHLLNAWDGVHAQPLQGILQSLVVRAGGFVHRLVLSVQQQQQQSGMVRGQIRTASCRAKARQGVQFTFICRASGSTPPHGALAACAHCTSHFHELVPVHDGCCCIGWN